MLLFLILSISSFSYSQNLPDYDGSGYCQDFAKVMTLDQVSSLNNKLLDIKETQGYQIAVVTVSSLQGYDIETYANLLFEKWGIGERSKDNGALIILSIGDRKSRIEVGYGLEPYLTDAKSRRILEEMKPYLRNKDFYSAFTNSIQSIMSVLPRSNLDDNNNSNHPITQVPIEESYVEESVPEYSQPVKSSDVLSVLLFILLICAFIFAIVRLYILYNEKKRDFLKHKDNFIDKLNKLSRRVEKIKHLLPDENKVSIADTDKMLRDMIGRLTFLTRSNLEKN